MSKKQAIAFFEEISKNKQLAQEVERVVEGKDSDEAKAKELISLAKKHNFIFTPEDAQNAQETLKKPLSPEEMLEVSGGKLNLKSSVMAAAMLLGLGATGATLHNMEASAMKRSTPPDGSYSFGGKRGKIDPPNSTQGQTLPGFDELVSGLSNRAPQGQPATTGTQQQTTPQTVGETNSAQRQTPPSNGQGSKPSNSGQTMRMTPPLRASTTSSAERHAPRQQQERKVRKNVEHDTKAAKRFDDIPGCSSRQVEWARRVSSTGALPAADWPAAPPAWFWRETTICRFCGKKFEARGKKELDVKCSNDGCIYNWVFPPTGDANLKGNQRGQLDYGHYARWALLPALILDSRLPTVGRGNNQRPRPAAIITPAEAWAVWQLIVGHNNAWVDVTNMMVNYGVDDDVIREVLGLLEDSYDNLVLGNESFIALGSEVQQLVSGYNDSWQQIRTTMEQRGYDAEGAIKLLEKSYNMLTDEQRQLGAQQWQQAEEARRQAIEEARRQVIEMLQRGEKLSVEQAKKIAPMLTCGNCGNTGAKPQNSKGHIYFYCKSCNAPISNLPDDLLAMLQEGAPGNAPVGIAAAEQNKQSMQFEIQSMQMNQGEGPTFALNFNSSTMPQIGMQGMNQFNHGQQMMPQQNMFAMEMDDEEDDEYNFDMGGYNGDENDNPNKPHEEKERPEDYASLEPVLRYPGMMGYQKPPQQMQMMNQVNHLQQLQPFNTVNDFNDIQQNATEYQQNWYNQFENQMNGQLQTMQNMDQMNGQLQHTQVDQDQQPINDQPGLTFGPTHVLQQLAAQQNVTQPPQKPNENGFTWQFDAENNEDTKPGSWNTWGQ